MTIRSESAPDRIFLIYEYQENTSRVEVLEGERDDRVAAPLENAVRRHEEMSRTSRVRDGFQQIHGFRLVLIFCQLWFISVDRESDVPLRTKWKILIYSCRFLEPKLQIIS